MDVLLLGSGSREHALAWKLGSSPQLGKLHAAPGNAAIARLDVTCHDVAADDVDAIASLAQELAVDLVVIGPENALVAGVANRLTKHGIACVGPSAAGARVEGSKVFAKELMDRAQVPTARWEAFSDVQAALAAINRWRGPVAVKADGLAGGAGTFLCTSKLQAERALKALLVESRFGIAGRRVIIEELLQGVEASIAVFADGANVVPLPVSQAKRRRADNDAGPTTDGMGAWLPVDELFEPQIEEAIDSCLRPILEEMAGRGLSYRGVLYADVIFTRTGPKVVEFNCRLGNLEAQLLTRATDEDLLPIFAQLAGGEIEQIQPLEIDEERAVVAISLVGGEYPAHKTSTTTSPLTGIEEASDVEGVEVFCDDVRATDGGALLAGTGHICTITAIADDIDEAARRAYAAAELVEFEGKHMRTDIAADVASFA